MNYIDFLFRGQSKTEKATFPVEINLKTIKHEISVKHFTGLANVYSNKILVWSINCENGVFHGDCTKYTEFIPSSIYGTLYGYLSCNWRQVEFIAKFRNGLFDGQVQVFKKDGSKDFIYNYSMGMLDGEQKHYTDTNLRILHKYVKGKYTESSKQAKNWLPWNNQDADEFASHTSLLARHKKLLELCK
jgi:antitoxin component YwqK of YwqJK toxin-antitoxin module